MGPEESAAGPQAAPEEAALEFKRLTVAVDGSKGSMRAMEAAIALAKRFRSELLAVYVVQPPAYTSPEYASIVPMLTKAGEDQGREVLKGVEATARSQGVEVATRLEVGPVRERLLEAMASYGPDLLVVGSRGLTGVRRFWLGSVSEAMVRYAGCSVLVVR